MCETDADVWRTGDDRPFLMSLKAIVIVVALAFLFGFCVMLLEGCAISLQDGNRTFDAEVFMPYVTEEVIEEEDQVVDLDWIK